jgi:hypothetical protein
MKSLIFLAFIAALLTACRKDSSPPGPVFLSKVILDGELLVEYVYNDEGQLIIEKNYDEHPGNTDLVSEYRYTYDGQGKLKEMTGYEMPENKPFFKYVYELGKAGNITRVAYFSTSGMDSGEIKSYQDYEYNSDGRAVKVISKGEDEKITSYREYKYFRNGNLRTMETYTQSGGGLEKSFNTSYSAGDTTLPESFYTVTALPANYYYPWLVSSYVESSIINDGLITERYGYFISDREYNSRGLLKKHTITLQSLLSAVQEPPKVQEYEYVER